MRRIHHRTSISPDRVPWRRRIAEAGTGAVLAAGMVAAASGPAAAGGPPVLAFTPSRHDYGQVTAGQTAAQTFTLASTGGKASRALTVKLSESAAFHHHRRHLHRRQPGAEHVVHGHGAVRPGQHRARPPPR